MNSIIIFGPAHSGKSTLLGYLSTGMMTNPTFNEAVYKQAKLLSRRLDSTSPTYSELIKDTKKMDDLLFRSFISLDRDELRRDPDGNTVGGTKRVHRRELSLCMPTRPFTDEMSESPQGEYTETVRTTFVDIPGFRQTLFDRYQNFFEGDIGLCVIDVNELLTLADYQQQQKAKALEKDRLQKYVKSFEARIFEPLRVWCSYRSEENVLILVSKIDRLLDNGYPNRLEQLERVYTYLMAKLSKFIRNPESVPIIPISVRLAREENRNKKQLKVMPVFFKRSAENIFNRMDDLPEGLSGPLVECLSEKLIISKEKLRPFALASVDRFMLTKRPNGARTSVLQIKTVHGNLTTEDTFQIGPVYNLDSKCIEYLTARPKSLKADGSKDDVSQDYRQLLEGNVGGLIFQSVTNKKEDSMLGKENAPKFKLTKTTMLYSASDIKRGDIVTVKLQCKDYILIDGSVGDDYDLILRSVLPCDVLFILWYGKKIQVRVIECWVDNEGEETEATYLSLQLFPEDSTPGTEFVLPLINNQESLNQKPSLPEDKVLLFVSEDIYRDDDSWTTDRPMPVRFAYITASIFDIKSSKDYKSMMITADSYLYLEYFFSKAGIDFLQYDDEEKELSTFSFPLLKDELGSGKGNNKIFWNSNILNLGRVLRSTLRSDYQEMSSFLTQKLSKSLPEEIELQQPQL